MRQINIRQFQRNFYTEIKNLPVMVTRRKHAVFIVSKPKDTKIIAEEPVQTVPKI